MKVFKKVFAFAIALTAIAMASSVMAATGNATYDKANHKVAANVDVSGISGQATVAVVPKDFGSNDAAAADIYYINQDAPATIATDLVNGVGLKTAALDFVPSEFEVRVGGGASVLDYEILPVVTNNDFVAAPDKTEGEPAGTKRVGHSGTFQFNGGTISKIKFTLSNGTETKVVDTSALGDAGKFTGSLNSVIGTVTFGIEIAGVPTGVDVSLQSVTVE